MILQLSTVTVVSMFGPTTFAQELALAPTPSSGDMKQEGEKRMGGERHRDEAEHYNDHDKKDGRNQ